LPGPDLLNRADVSGLAITYPPVEVGVGNADGSVESDCQAILARTPRFDWKAPFEADADQRASTPRRHVSPALPAPDAGHVRLRATGCLGVSESFAPAA